ncbi:CoA transferase subunit A [Saccharopolyspora tripterygii]
MRDKTTSLSEAAALIQDGATVGIGGSILRRHPMALIREIVRQGRRDLTLQAWLGGIDFDLLVGAGCVRRIESAYQGLGPLGGAPNIRRAWESETIEIGDFTESSMIARFRAASQGHPFAPAPVLTGTDIQHSPDVAIVNDPFTGKPVPVVRPAKADVAILHGYYSDSSGNVQVPVRHNRDSIDVLIAGAADTVIVTVEELVSHAEIVKRPHATYIPHHWVDAVVEVPAGAHPGNCDAFYEPDTAALREYLEAATTPETFAVWLERYVHTAHSHAQYLERATEPARFAALLYPNEA